MNKSYSIGSVVYHFTNVRMECGMLYGMCTNPFFYGRMALLDPSGFQWEGGRQHFDALEVVAPTTTDNSYTMWGGQLRDRLPHGARYYQRGRR